MFVDQHYTVAEVAALLRVHQMTVRHWYSKQGLRIQRVGKQGVRIAAADLRSFLEKCNRGDSRFTHKLDQRDSTVSTRRSSTGVKDDQKNQCELGRW